MKGNDNDPYVTALYIIFHRKIMPPEHYKAAWNEIPNNATDADISYTAIFCLLIFCDNISSMVAMIALTTKMKCNSYTTRFM